MNDDEREHNIADDVNRDFIERLKAGKAYLHTLVDAVPDFVLMKDVNGRFLYCNHRFEEIMGITKAELIGKTDYDFFDKEMADLFTQADHMAIKEGRPFKTEEELVYKSDGHTELMEIVKTPIVGDDGELMGVVGIGRDITEHKRLEEERLANVNFFTSLDRINTVLQMDTDLETVLRNTLDLMLEMFNCQRAFFLSPCNPDSSQFTLPFLKTVEEFPGLLKEGEMFPVTPEFSEIFTELVESKDLIEAYVGKKDGSEMLKALKIKGLLQVALFPRIGEPWIFGIHNCIEERRWEAEEKRLFKEIGIRIGYALTTLLMYKQVQKNEKFYTNIFENIPTTIFIKSAQDLSYVGLNHAGEKLLGVKKDEVLGKGDYELFPENADFIISKDREVLESGQLIDIPQNEVSTALHNTRILHTQKIPICDDQGRPEFLLGISEDITERIEAEKELATTKEWLQAFMESTSESIVIFNENDCIIQVNNHAIAHFRMFDFDAYNIVGTHYTEILNSSDNAVTDDRVEFSRQYELVKNTGGPLSFDKNYTVNDQSFWFNYRLFRVGKGMALIATDITEQRSLEEQLRQIQKIESIGRLAGGVAHDYNNHLGVIMGYTDLVLNLPNTDEVQRPFLEEILAACRRSAKLTYQLLAFARKQDVVPRVLDLNTTIDGMHNMLTSLIGEHIELVWRPQGELWPVKIDPGQVDQIVANLCVNARDAIESDSGRITIQTGNIFLGDAYCRIHAGCVPGEYVFISVTDNGKGMDKQTVSMIFEPFFTTKELGEGTGLGLSTVYGIVKQNNGYVYANSEPGVGTSFKIFFPHEKNEIRTHCDSAEVSASGGSEKLLIVEDDEKILNMIALMLKSLGYDVLTASAASDAIVLTEEHAGTIDLILSDVIMPGMNGKDLQKGLLENQPDALCLFMSGYTDDIIGRHGILNEGIHFIQKPFSKALLDEKIRSILEGRA